MAAPKTDESAIRQTIRALRKADHVITAVEDGASEVHQFQPDASEDAIIAEVTSCDDGYLFVDLPDGTTSHVWFVLGNDPEEVIADHGASLSPVLDPLAEKWGDS